MYNPASGGLDQTITVLKKEDWSIDNVDPSLYRISVSKISSAAPSTTEEKNVPKRTAVHCAVPVVSQEFTGCCQTPSDQTHLYVTTC